jgi:acyl-CoA synthetase (AMP-forming)/AMP-acid ligase II
MTFEQVGRHSLASLLELRAEETPDEIAIAAVSHTLSFGEWRRRSAGLATRLEAAFGDLRGERLVFWMTNEDAPEFACAMIAAASRGAIVVALDDRATASEVGRVLAECTPRAALLSPQVCANLGPRQHELELDEPRAGADDGPRIAVVRCEGSNLSQSAFTWRAETDDAQLPSEGRAEDDVMIAYTSGSTGRPKGALWTQGAVAMYGERVTRATYAEPRRGRCLGPDDVLQSPIPLYTAASVIENLAPTIFSGCRLLYEGRRFDAAASEARMHDEATTVYNGAPPHFALMCDLPPAESPPALGLLISGGSAFTEPLYRRMRKRWPRVAIANWYGLNESGTGQTLNHGTDLERAPAAIGRPLWPTNVRIVDEQRREVDPGGEGELWMRAAGQLREYFRNPAETAKRLSGDWLRTGDRARADTSGLIHVVGRGEDRINRGGFKLYPVEIESALESHPDVREAAVVGVPDAILGQELVAFVVPADGRSIDPADLRAHCRAAIAPNKVPRQILIREQLPRGAYGKVVRRELLAEYARLEPAART